MGFVVPNATGFVGKNLAPAEPDQLDFSTLGDGTRGVLSGCFMTVSSGSATMSAATPNSNVVYINNASFFLPDSVTVVLGDGSGQDRWDIFVFDVSDNRVKVVQGIASQTPILPTPTDDQVWLWALFVPSGLLANNTDSSYFIDKRHMLAQSFIGVAADGAPFIRNSRGNTDVPYQVLGDGTTTWTDVSMYRDMVRSLTVDGALKIGNDLSVNGGVNVGGNMVVVGLVSGSNMLLGFGVPSDGFGIRGAMYQQFDGDGALWVKGINHWGKLLADVGAADGNPATGVPPGSIIDSFLPPGHSLLAGWLPLDGSIYSSGDPSLGRLWALATGAGAVAPFTNWLVNSNTALRLPSGDDVVRMQSGGGVLGLVEGSMEQPIAIQNLPAHKHFGNTGQTAGAGGHTHPLAMTSAGSHSHVTREGGHIHSIGDPGHSHGGSAWFGSAIIAAVFGGQNKLDGPINDASHTISVDGVGGTAPAATGINVNDKGSTHGHEMDPNGDHTHQQTLTAAPDHVHSMPPEASVGSGTPLDITPAHINVKYYIKT